MKMGVERENLSSSVRALHLIDTKYRERTAIPFTPNETFMFALSAREEEDQKTIGQLFYLCCDEMEDNNCFTQALIRTFF